MTERHFGYAFKYNIHKSITKLSIYEEYIIYTKSWSRKPVSILRYKGLACETSKRVLYISLYIHTFLFIAHQCIRTVDVTIYQLHACHFPLHYCITLYDFRIKLFYKAFCFFAIRPRLGCDGHFHGVCPRVYFSHFNCWGQPRAPSIPKQNVKSFSLPT